MRPLILVTALALGLGFGQPGLATPGQDMVTASLQQQGFEVRLVHWTLLGRIRIIAVSDTVRREIVINPNTGEILRDYSQAIAVVPVEQSHHGNSSDSAIAADPVPTRLSDDVDASAVSALEGMSMGVGAPLVAEPVQP
jgi:hypothetical protein